MKTVKKLLSLLLVLALCVSLGVTALAAPGDAKTAADHLYSLGLFRGTGTDAAGNPVYELDRAPSRAEAVTMLVRLLGKDAAAQSGAWTIPFTDVPAWAVPYVGYAYANGLTNGVSATEFGSTATASATMYITFVLRALGYSDKDGDFAWDRAWELSDSLGITDGSYNAGTNASFTRGGVAIVSDKALEANYKGSETTLLARLQAEGAVLKSLKIAVLTDIPEPTPDEFSGVSVAAAARWAARNASVSEAFYVFDANGDVDSAVWDRVLNGGYDVVIGAGFLYATFLPEAAAQHPETVFLVLDSSAEDAELERVPENLLFVGYHEELCGYLAGYAAVALGYTELGFLGGMEIPAVQRYGIGFVQGAEAAAAARGVSGVHVRYAYAAQFWPSPYMEEQMGAWYGSGTQVVFSCGGNICENVLAAAEKAGGRMIGVDQDQSALGDAVITSAMKGIAATVEAQLTAIRSGSFTGGSVQLGLVSAEDPALNYAQLPETTRWGAGFTEADYQELLQKLISGALTVSDDIDRAPGAYASVVTVGAVEHLIDPDADSPF